MYLPCTDFGVGLRAVVSGAVWAVLGVVTQGYDPRAPSPVVIGLLEIRLQPVCLFHDVLSVRHEEHLSRIAERLKWRSFPVCSITMQNLYWMKYYIFKFVMCFFSVSIVLHVCDIQFTTSSHQTLSHWYWRININERNLRAVFNLTTQPADTSKSKNSIAILKWWPSAAILE